MERKKYIRIGLTIIVVFAIAAFVYNKLPNEKGDYQTKMEQFKGLESTAINALNFPETESKANVLTAIQTKGINNWKEAIKIVDEIDRLSIPDRLHARNKMVKQYCELRLQCYELMYKSYDEDTDKYNKEIAEYKGRIEAILMQLSMTPSK